MQKKEKKNIHIIQISIVCILIIILLMSYLYINCIKTLAYKNIYNNITELNEQTATQLNITIENQKKFVEIMIESINKGMFQTEEEIFERYKHDLASYHFTRLVILDEEGNGSTSDNNIVKNYKDIKEFFESDEVALSENRPSTVSNNQVNIYSKTFKLKGENKVLFATINTENYQEILSRRLFNGKGRTYLVNNEGTILIDSYELIKDNNIKLYDYLKEEYEISPKEQEKIQNMQANIKKKNTGTFDIKLNKELNFLNYEKIGINDWYVITIASDNTIAKELTQFLSLSLLLCLLIIAIICGVSIYIYISNKRQNIRLYKTAYIDKVTLLKNENYLKDNGSLFLKDKEEDKYIIVMDINKFQTLTKMYDYDFCNLILKSVGEYLTKILPENSIVCHTSRDIYILVFNYQKNIKKLINKIIEDLEKIKIRNVELNLSVKLGIYKVNKTKEDLNRVLDKAYMAHSKIKNLYNQNYYIFDEDLERKLLEAEQIEAEMEGALANKEFKIVYQPKFYTKDETLAGMEALVRWYKGNEIISPTKFIPLFEKNKFILKLDLYIFEEVCKTIKEWKNTYQDIPVVSVNVSKEHFIDENFIEEYIKIADKYEIERDKIDLEITESATINEDIDILNILNKIKEKGFIISIDDFGTGYSSLSMLQNMPFDILKIDKTFIEHANLKSNKNIINYIALIAKQLGVKTIVEGVETKEQKLFIKRLKCDIIQGFYYSKPIDKEEMTIYIAKKNQKNK